jgi:hypothetical protein
MVPILLDCNYLIPIFYYILKNIMYYYIYYKINILHHNINYTEKNKEDKIFMYSQKKKN